MAIKRYCLGFAFSPPGPGVLLIRKKHPEWQAGKYNGLGGKVGDKETHAEAMVREFKEECGLTTKIEDWKFRIDYVGPDYRIYIFMTKAVDIFEARTLTDEEVNIIDVAELRQVDVIPNLHWMIPFCLDEYVDMALLKERPNDHRH